MRKLDNLILKTLGHHLLADQVLDVVGAHVYNDLNCVICGRNDDTDLCLPYYSTDIKAAWELVSTLTKAQWRFFISGEEWDWNVEVSAGDSNCHHNKPYDSTDGHGYSFVEVYEKEAPLAICLAFLRAKNVPEEEITAALKD